MYRPQHTRLFSCSLVPYRVGTFLFLMVMSCAKRFSSQELEVVSMAKKMPRQAPHLRVRIEPKLLAKLEKSREKNAHTLTGEIVTRLEQSYEADEQATIAEQFTDLRQRLEVLIWLFSSTTNRFSFSASLQEPPQKRVGACRA